MLLLLKSSPRLCSLLVYILTNDLAYFNTAVGWNSGELTAISAALCLDARDLRPRV